MRHLFFWKGVENASFQQIDGKSVYFPWGIFGSGYIVSEEKRAEISKFLSWYYLIGSAVIVLGIFLDVRLLLAAFALLIAYLWFMTRRHTAGLTRSDRRLTFAENQRAVANTMSKGRLYFVISCGVFMTAMGVFATWWLAQKGDEQFWIGIGATIFFSTCLLMGIHLLRLKQRGTADPQ